MTSKEINAWIPEEAPTKIYISGLEENSLLGKELKIALSYVDQKMLFAAKQFKKTGFWYLRQHGKAAFDEKVEEMLSQAKKTMLWEENGFLCTYSGNKSLLESKLNILVECRVNYPSPKLIPWANKPKFPLRDYQQKIVESLVDARHGCISAGTGLGKSYAIMHLIKEFGLKTILISPATSITQQLFLEAKELFGPAYVGAYFDGKKDHKKLITVGNAQSFARVKEDTEAYKSLSSCKVLIFDESHQTPAETMASVCFGVAGSAPYRFFFSATQMRGDGLGPLLNAITGPQVFDMTVRDGVNQGYLAKPVFRIVQAKSDSLVRSEDPNEMTRTHLFYNPDVVQKVAQIVNECHLAKLPTLVLIEEVEQFSKLLPYLKVRPGFAHGTLNDENKPKVPKEYWDSDPNALVKDFNEGNLSVLVGTSCISTGTDIRPVKILIYWQGGKSEVQVKQAIGRGTRKVEGKDKCTVIDFDVYNIESVHRHAKIRRSIYNEIYGPVENLTL